VQFCYYKNCNISQQTSILANPIAYLKGVGPLKGDLLKKELEIFTFEDLLYHFPLRHLDKTNITPIAQLQSENYAQVAGKLISYGTIGEKRSKRLIAQITDGTSLIELVWFQGISWIEPNLHIGSSYLVFGKCVFFNGNPQMAHPEIEVYHGAATVQKNTLDPIYPSTEKLKPRGLNGRNIAKLTEELLKQLSANVIVENIPDYLLKQLKLFSKYEALKNIHFPLSIQHYQQALRRLKFEELFIAQIRVQQIQVQRHMHSKGFVFEKVGDLFTQFFNNYMPFELTNAQKKVIKEIRLDLAKGKQMNRLLQGDVGSGKTMVGLMTMLIAVGNGYQTCLMAPTEILAKQHYEKILTQLLPLQVNVALLTGSTKAAQKRKILAQLAAGDIQILIGTHALIEPTVVFNNLGLAVIDEQHKFGVAQRSQLWKKATLLPHILVMTATPIPRTLAMTAYGDLDVSIIDELPPGRQEIKTVHRYDNERYKIYQFIKDEISKGRQAYVIYPLIEESSKLDYENLMQGYEDIKAYFPEPKYWISMVHGKQDAITKQTNMDRFATNDTQILVGTTVIEVGVDVPNATILLLESAEKFGLSQLHQLRGRVGRGAEQSFCVLLTSSKLSADAKERLKIMCATNDGFKIAEKDLELRGPGQIDGTKQSGALHFKLADIVQDKVILEAARNLAREIVLEDVNLSLEKNVCIKNYLASIQHKTGWGKIS
jgi:ATP-dependent DNA helicase RecG